MTKYQELKAEVDKLLLEIKQLQETCRHESRQLTPQSYRDYGARNTEYWYDIKCLDCGKFWSEDQAVYKRKYGITHGGQ